MARLDLATRRRVISWYFRGFTVGDIIRKLEEENTITSKKTIYLLLGKYKQTSSVHDLPRCTRKMLTVEHYCYIDEVLSQDDETTCVQLRSLLHEQFTNINVSLATVKRARKDLGWVSSTPHYCQLIREKNKQKRVERCRKCIDENERFTDVIWTDECSVQLEPHRKTCSRRKGKPKPLKPRPKHPPESPDLNPIENVWGSLKVYLRNRHFRKDRPRNLFSLREGIKAFWKSLTPEICTRYIHHVHTVIPEVLNRDGEASGY